MLWYPLFMFVRSTWCRSGYCDAEYRPRPQEISDLWGAGAGYVAPNAWTGDA